MLPAAVSGSVTNFVRSKSNAAPSVAVCCGIAVIVGALSTAWTAIWNRSTTAGATPSLTSIVTSCVPASVCAGVPEIVAGALNRSQAGNVGAVICSALPSGSDAVSA